MPLAEQFGIAPKLQAWFFQQIYQAANEWEIMRNPSFKMAIQAHSFSLFPETVNQLEAIIQRKSVDPGCFEIGLKESYLIGQEKETSLLIQQLQQVGVTVALEYVGQGLLSLSRIKQLGIETVKLNPLLLKLAEEEGLLTSSCPLLN